MSHAVITVSGGAALRGRVSVPGDKSISHRAIILGALATGETRVRGWLAAGDTLATLASVRALGVHIVQHTETELTVYGRGLRGLRAPSAPLYCANAGTAMRLLAGALAGQRFHSTLDGSAQLRRRPMRRITEPLRAMGAHVGDTNGHAPLHFAPASLHGMTYAMPIPSAQVKSCLMLAGLYAKGPLTVVEPGPARDHTERLLRAMGADIRTQNGHITLTPPDVLRPLTLDVPADISSAAFVLIAALLAGAGRVCVQGVGVNPTRTGLLDILQQMGARIALEDARESGGEPIADLCAERATLRGAEIGGALIVRAIDEFPALMVAATQAEGVTHVRDAAELRFKETDRIAVMAAELHKLGAEIEELADGFRVVGPQRLRGADVDAHDDHRVGMALALAGLVAEGETRVHGAHAVRDSFPSFVEVLSALGASIHWGARNA